jgi:hypothetical protein
MFSLKIETMWVCVECFRKYNTVRLKENEERETTGQSKFWFEIRVLVAEISGRSRGAVKLHNIGDNPMRVEVIEWSLIDSSVILETFDNNEGRENSCAHI